MGVSSFLFVLEQNNGEYTLSFYRVDFLSIIVLMLLHLNLPQAVLKQEEKLAGKAAPKKNMSALKKVRQAGKNKLRNKAVRTSIKTAAKKLQEAISEKNMEKVQGALIEASRVISKAAQKGVIHKNTASRKISRFSKIANTVLKSEAA